MMLSHPVLLGFLWSLLLQALRGQAQISNQENKVYAYSYHFQHNGTTNSKDILRSVLGTDPELGFDNDDKSIIKTFSSPNIRGFFTKGILPGGPINSGFGGNFRSNFNSNPAIENIKNVIQSSLQPPSSNIARGILPPISPDIRNEFPGDFNNVNDIGLNYQPQDDFPKIPPPPPPPILQNQNNYPQIQPVVTIPSLGQNNFPDIPPPPPIPSLNVNLPQNVPNNNNGLNKIENFERDTPDGGKIVGQVETFSYNPPLVSNRNSNYQENAEGFRRKENFVNNNQQVTGHRTQSYFRQQFRTVTPNIDSNSLFQNNRVNNRDSDNSNNNDNQWWNALNVLGGKNNNNINNNHNNNQNQGNNYNNNNGNGQNFGQHVDQNINQIRNNINKEINRAFGSRISNSNNRQNFARNNNDFKPNTNIEFNERNNNQNPTLSQIHKNQPQINIPFNNNAVTRVFNRRANDGGYQNNQRQNNVLNNRQQNNANYISNQGPNNILNNHPQNNVNYRNNPGNNNFNNNQPNLNNQFNNDDTTRRVLGLINEVSSRLTNNPEKFSNDIGVTWDDVIQPKNFNHDWSRRQSFGTGRPFSNGHSGPLNNIDPKPIEVIKTSIEALAGNRDIPVPPIPEIGNQDGNYRNVGGGGNEKFFNVNKVVEGPNSFSQNHHRGFERNFHVNSNNGFQRTNQWSTNVVRRLDAQSTRDDFSKDFIDVFREDY
ncbi:myb-like protein D isoform X2 [Parasteatoda tepidariorum]|nr:GATA zinc finger domain-containing protein 14-like [Parasteatoda tepidariorum]